jgi:hypothetical protein
MAHKVFLIEPDERVEQSADFGCACGRKATEVSWEVIVPLGQKADISDEGFPCAVCECGHVFDLKRSMGRSAGRYWRRVDTGEVKRRTFEFGTGAMWRADWYTGGKIVDGKQLYGWDWDNQFEGPLVVMTPGGEWVIDSRASNCGRPDDRTHRCWVRHGEPPNIHVDKNGDTCAAGAGSIVCGNYHGFLHNGFLTDGC